MQHSKTNFALPLSQYWRQLGLQADPFPLDQTLPVYITLRWQQYLDFLVDPENYRKKLVLAVGKPGVGKTTVLNKLQERLQYKINLLRVKAQRGLGAEHLSALLASEFGAVAAENSQDLYATLQQQIASLQTTNQRYLLLIDDAEQLPRDAKEFCLRIMQMQQTIKPCLYAVLFGESELFTQLEEITQDKSGAADLIITLNVEPFNREEIQQYIKASLKAVEYDGRITLFSQTDIYLIAEASQGLPGNIARCARESLLDIVAPTRHLEQNKTPASMSKIAQRTKWWLGALVIIAILLFWVWPWLQRRNAQQNFSETATPVNVNETVSTPQPKAPQTSAAGPGVVVSTPLTAGDRVVVDGKVTTIKPTSAASTKPTLPSIAPAPASSVAQTVAPASAISAQSGLPANISAPQPARSASAPTVNALKPITSSDGAISTPLAPDARIVVDGKVSTVKSTKSSNAAAALNERAQAIVNQEIKQAPAIDGETTASTSSAPQLSIKPAPAASSVPSVPKMSIKPTPTTKVSQPVMPLSPVVLTDTEQRLLKISGKMYTLQLFLTTDPQSAQDFIQEHSIGDLASVYRTVLKHKIVYVVSLGYFPSQSEALTTVQTLDPALQKLHPWPKSFATIHKEIRELPIAP